MLKFKKSLLALTALTLLSVYVFAKNDDQDKELVAPKQSETPCTDMEAPGTFVSSMFNPNVIIIVCQGSEGLCFTIHDKELTTYSRTGAPETYNVTSVSQINGKGDNMEYIIGVE
ncbi:MAG: hypothetical protein II817_12275 [Bacteroidales bacterium]|nr:hypothetical protein [Bacteroidales bacterium]